MNGRKTLGIMLVLPLIGMLMMAFTVQPCIQADVLEVELGMAEESWEEGWESSSVGVYHPFIPGPPETKISGDTGDWQVGDTISASGGDYPEYGDWSPNYAEIEETPEGKKLIMTITFRENHLSDLIVLRPILTVPLNENTTLSFTLHGEGAGTKGIALSMHSLGGICYSIHGTPSKGMGENIPLEGDGGTYTRNIFDDWTNILGNEYEGTEEFTLVALFVQDLVSDGVGVGTFDDIHMAYTRPSEPEPLRWIESCDLYGTAKDSFDLGETVYVMGGGFSHSLTMDFYIVDAVETWTDGMLIPARIPATVMTVVSDAFGEIPSTAVWVSPETIGAFDLIVDVLGDGMYMEGVDALDDGDVGESAGAEIIPELPPLIVLPLFMITTLLTVILFKRKHSL